MEQRRTSEFESLLYHLRCGFSLSSACQANVLKMEAGGACPLASSVTLVGVTQALVRILKLPSRIRLGASGAAAKRRSCVTLLCIQESAGELPAERLSLSITGRRAEEGSRAPPPVHVCMRAPHHEG